MAKVDMYIFYGDNVPNADRALIFNYICSDNFNYSGGERLSLIKELEIRGYDLDTLKISIKKMGDRFREVISSLMGVKTLWDCGNLLAEEKINKLGWVIVGGESGHNARITNPKWVLSLRQQCEDSKVPFFFKQWGEFVEEKQMMDKYTQMKGQTYSLMSDGSLTFWRCGRKLAGKLLNGKICQEFPR